MEMSDETRNKIEALRAALVDSVTTTVQHAERNDPYALGRVEALREAIEAIDEVFADPERQRHAEKLALLSAYNSAAESERAPLRRVCLGHGFDPAET